MDIYDRLVNIEERLTALENLVQTERTKAQPRQRNPQRTEYMPAVTDEMVELSKLDQRVEGFREEPTKIERRPKDTNPNLRAAVSAVARAVEVAKEAQLLVEDVQHLAKTLMDEKK